MACWRLLAFLWITTRRQLAVSWVPYVATNRSEKKHRLWAKKSPSSTNDSNSKDNDKNILRSLLARYGFDTRQNDLKATDLPVIAEVYLNGKLELCDITALRPTKDPTLQIELLSSGDSHVVDIGQITTVWESGLRWEPNVDLENEIQKECNQFPVGSMEASLDGLYNSHVGRARQTSNKHSLTKKQIGKLVAPIAFETQRLQADSVLRQLLKTGTGCARLVDSATTAQVLYDSSNNPVLQHAVAAHLLAQDAEAGGRFKRMPCTCVEKNIVDGEDGEKTVASLSIINGGWLVVDQSVRAGSEARKFAEKVHSKKGETQNTDAWTISDERIAQRLECLAMGEVFGTNNKEVDQSGLEVDVREALKALGAPATSEGARNVLIKIGRWSASDDQRFGVQPWSPTVLEASLWYREEQLSMTKAGALREGYTDLTNIPFVCVDAKRTNFRDDAIGVRPRAGTSRKTTGASKWEILISIADVSDVYAEVRDSDKTSSKHRMALRQKHLMALREAAASRGVSRYDLPLGPLHLMPPVVLEALSFSTQSPVGNEPKDTLKGCNRCVTVWVYIDEKTGKLLDAGIERSVISQPVALSYQQATDLLERNADTSQNALLHRTAQVLGVVEQGILSWSQARLENSDAAKKREGRLAVKEFVATQQLQHQDSKKRQNRRDDGHGGFQRTRGHKLVDASLDLYSYTITGLLRRLKVPVPQQAGSGQARGGRVATAPLRRYVDGMAQRQALSALLGYGRRPMSLAECRRVSQEATEAYNTISNVRSIKKSASATIKGPSNQKSAIRSLKIHLSGDKRKVVPAVGTGRGNEVVISGVGALAKCKGVKGTLKPGEKILVQVNKIDVDNGSVAVSRAS